MNKKRVVCMETLYITLILEVMGVQLLIKFHSHFILLLLGLFDLNTTLRKILNKGNLRL
jgi:hypothetical protein